MNITKPNDIFVATLNNPSVAPFDLISNNILGENTSLYPKEDYKQSKFVKDAFTTSDGKFDEESFDKMYKIATDKYVQLTNEEYINGLDSMQYSPFDITRPKDAKTFAVGSIYTTEVNPFQTLKG
jgi:hypothetical protein